MIKRDENLLFEPCGTNSNHKCKECKNCFVNFLYKRDHCDLCGSIDAEDYACRNRFEEGRTYSNVNFENRINIP